jgi:hypothetical protein
MAAKNCVKDSPEEFKYLIVSHFGSIFQENAWIFCVVDASGVFCGNHPDSMGYLSRLPIRFQRTPKLSLSHDQ